MGNEKLFKATDFTYAVVVRGELPEINKLVDYLKQSKITVAHTKISTVKLWIVEKDEE